MIPWGRISVIGGAISVILGIVLALRAEGLVPVTVARFEPVEAQVSCEVCLRQCATVWCPECTTADCKLKCQETGECR